MSYNKIINSIQDICNKGITELQKTIINNNIIKVTTLLKDEKTDPSENSNIAIIEASRHGRTDIVKLLLNDPRVDPSDEHNLSIIDASRNGHTNIVKLLLNDSRVDPSDDDNIAITLSFLNQHINKNKEIYNLLWLDKRVNKLLKENEPDFFNEILAERTQLKIKIFK